ncbi:MAG TPA: adenylosuccinate lyase family protein [Candidatus Dormibacteraeota bacterium]
MAEIVSDASWLQAMLDVEAALARAQAKLKLIPDGAASEIAAHCRADQFDIAEIGLAAAESANPVVPIVRALRSKVGQDAAPYVHRGTTSQDILDTAMMLIVGRALDAMLEDMRSAADSAASLADRHRSTVMAGRTLLQQAAVTTFGLKAAGWLTAIIEARDALTAIRDSQLAVQLGGAVGTRATLTDGDVEHELASELKLQRPVLPWHTDRMRVVNLSGQLAIAAGVMGKIALDIVLLAQTEVGEVREGGSGDRGASSTMPQKRNPVDSVEILAAVRGANAQAGMLLASMVQEHERAAGAWQAEWRALSELLLLSGGTTWRAARLLGSLEVDAERMRRNLDLSGGLIMSEGLVMKLAERTDLLTARALVEAAVSQALGSGQPFKQLVLEDARITQYLRSDELARVFEPSSNLGSAAALIDRALDHYRSPGTKRTDR